MDFKLPSSTLPPRDEAIARERGRQMAVEMLLVNPIARVRLEAKYSLDYLRDRYPEVYDEKPLIPWWKQYPR